MQSLVRRTATAENQPRYSPWLVKTALVARRTRGFQRPTHAVMPFPTFPILQYVRGIMLYPRRF